MKTLATQIFDYCKSKGLKPHSIVNDCMLFFDDGTPHISGKNKRDLLNKLHEKYEKTI